MKSALIPFTLLLLLACNENTHVKQQKVFSPVTSQNGVIDGYGKNNLNADSSTRNNKLSSNDILPLELTPKQNFTVNTSRDTTLVCKGGTRITVPAHALIDELSKTEVSGPVVVSVNEFYNKSDIFLAQLTTNAGNDMLESGGMVYIGASSNNRSCALQPGKQIQLTFPFKNKKEGMQTFYGDRNENGINWKTPATIPQVVSEGSYREYKIEPADEKEDENKIYDIASLAEIPLPPTGFKEYLMKNIKYPSICKEMGIQGRVWIEFVIEKDGSVNEVKIKRGLYSPMDQEAVRVIKNSPKWVTGKINGKPVRTKMVQPINFRLNDGGPYISSNKLDSLRRADTEKQLQTEATSVEKEEINQYIISSAQLGWINCDRFVQPSQTIFAVKEESNNVICGMMFHSINSYLRGTFTEGKFTFSRIPANEKVTIISCKKENGINYLSLITTNTSAGSITPVYKEVTLEELKAEVKKLNFSSPATPEAI